MVINYFERCFKLSIIVVLLFSIGGLNAQTYASEQLKREIEERDSKKAEQILEKEDQKLLDTETAKLQIVDITNQKESLYKLTNISLTSDDEINLNNERLEGIQRQIETEKQKTLYYLDLENNILFDVVDISKPNFAKSYKIKVSKQQIVLVSDAQCKSCKKKYFKIITKSSEALILQIEDEDEQDDFSYQLTFEKL